MKLPNKYNKRLQTKNFTKVTSEAVISIDYYLKQNLLEIEYSTGKIYHYLNINKEIWNKFLKFARKGKGLGTYINQDFKQMVNEGNGDYYELVS